MDDDVNTSGERVLGIRNRTIPPRTAGGDLKLLETTDHFRSSTTRRSEKAAPTLARAHALSRSTTAWVLRNYRVRTLRVGNRERHRRFC